MKKTIWLKLSTFVLVISIVSSLFAPAALGAFVSLAGEASASSGKAETVSPSEPSDAEKQIAEFKAAVLRLVNEERKKAELPALESLDKLNEMADVRAKESASSFSHTRPDGTRCFTVFADFSLKYRAAGENLAYGFQTPEGVVAAWMASPAHKANILDKDFTYLGIGYFPKDNGKIYCSQLFYTPLS